jgi:hypothetical protein
MGSLLDTGSIEKWAIDPLSPKGLRSLSPALTNTCKTLPEIHPVWRQLAAIDAMKLMNESMKICPPSDSDQDFIPMLASIGAFGVLLLGKLSDSRRVRQAASVTGGARAHTQLGRGYHRPAED